MDLEQTQALDFSGDFDDEDETDDEEAVKKTVAHLKVKGQKEFEEKVFEIYEGDNVIGRHEVTCSVWIPLKALSREHACIEVKGDSHFIYDKGSRNKTRRGKAVLKPDVRYELTSNTSVTFGDVEAVYYIGEEINDKGSETGSESFQTAPTDDDLGMEAAGKEGAAGVTLLVTEEEEDYDSDASVDLLQPTQAYHGGRTLNLAPDSDEEEVPRHKPNVTVQDTPLPPTRHGAVGTTAISTLVLPESDSEDEEEDRRKARALQSLQTQVVADTQQDDEEEEEGEENNNVCPAMFGATQAYVMESEPDDDATDDENAGNASAAIFAAETQAFAEEGDDKKNGDDDQPVLTFVADSDEDSDGENVKASIMDDDTEGEDDAVDVSHIFAASTLACDMVDEEEEPVDMKEAPQVDVADDDVATQMVTEDATQVVAATRITEDQEEATQVVEEDGDSENIATQCLDDATVAVITGDPTLAVSDGATVAIAEDAPVEDTTGDATVAIQEEETMAIAETESFSVNKDATMAVNEDATMAVNEDATMAVKEDATMAITEDATMAITEDATMAVKEDATMAITEDATMAITEDATMAVKEDATMAVTEDATMAVTEDATMAIEATVNVTDATMAVNEEEATQVIEDESELEETSHKKKSGRGRPGRKSKTKQVMEEDATQVLGDATAGEATSVVEDVNVPQDMPGEKKVRRGRRGKGRKETEGDTSKAVNDTTTEEEATQVIGDVSVESEVQGKVSNRLKAGVGRGRKSKAREVFEEEATQMVEDSEIEEQATQVIEDELDDTTKQSTEKVKGHRGRPEKRGKGGKITEAEATQMVEDTEIEEQATQVIEDVSDDTTKESTEKVRGHRGHPGKRGKGREITEDEAAQMVEDTEIEEQATQVIEDESDDTTKQSTEKVRGHRGRPGKRGKGREMTEDEATQMVEDTEIEEQATQVIEDESDDTTKESTERVKGHRGRPGKRGKGGEITEDEATQMVEDVSTEVPEEHKPISPVGRSQRRAKTRETTEEVSGGEEATQVYGMESDEEELDRPRGRSGRARSPRRGTDRVQKDLVNLPALQPSRKETDPLASMDVEGATQRYGEEAATQRYGEDEEEDTPPLSEEVVQDSEDVLGKSPVIPLPPTSPHKSALSSPEKRSKSPSPKRVKFAIESQSSESTVGEEEEKAGPSSGHTATRSKLATTEVKKSVTRGRRSLPGIAIEENKEIASRSKDRRSLPASDLDNTASGKKSEKKRKIEMEDVKELGNSESEVEPPTTGRRGGRRSVGTKVSEEPNIKGKSQGRKSTSEETQEQKEENNVNKKKGKGKGKGRNSTKLEEVSVKVEDTILKSVEESENGVGKSTCTPDKESTESKVEAPVEEVKGRGRGRRSIQAGGRGDGSAIEKNKEKTTKLVRIVGKRKQAEAEEPVSTESTPDSVSTESTPDSPSIQEEEVKGRTSSRGRKSKQAAVESKSTEKAQEETRPAKEVIEKGRTASRGRRSKQPSEEETKEKEEEENVVTGGRDKKLKPVEEEDKQKSTIEAAEKLEEVIPTSKQGSKKGKEVKDTSEDKVEGPVAPTSRGGRGRSKQVANISDSVEYIEEKTGRTAGGRSNKKAASQEEISLPEVVTEQEEKEEGPRTARGGIQGRKSNKAVQDKEEVTVKETAEVTEPQPRRGGRGKKVAEPSKKDSAETEVRSAIDLANMSGISERRSRGRGKPSVEVVSVDSRVESRTSRQRGDRVSVDSEKTEESQSDVSTSRRTKAKGASKTKEGSVSKVKTSEEENTEEESEFELTKSRTKGRGKASNLKEDVNVTKCKEENDSCDVRSGRGKKADTSVSVTGQEGAEPGEVRRGRGKKADTSVSIADQEGAEPGEVRRGRGRKADTSVSIADQEGAEPGPSRKGKAASRGKRGHSQDQDVIETPAKVTKDKAAPGTPVQSKTNVTVDSPSLRRKSMDPKPRVMFTGMVDEQGQKIVNDLGGVMVTSIQNCTHLVTDKVRRTVKLLCCLSRGIPIVLPTWLSSSKQTGMFIQDVTPYLVKDTAAEKQYKFSLQRSIERASQASVLVGYQIHVTKSVRPDPTQMKDILECAGAVYLDSVPCKFTAQTVVVSCEEDRKLCQDALKVDIPVVNAEFVLTGILQQEANPYNYQIFSNSKKRPADSTAEGPSKRRRR